MGYTTKFEGKFEIVIPESMTEHEQDMFFHILKTALNKDYRKDSNIQSKYGINTRWCDWMLTTGLYPNIGNYIEWNGNEKSYNMYEWIHYLNEEILCHYNVVLKGRVTAQGEDSKDIWAIEIDAVGTPHLLKGRIVYDLDMEDDRFNIYPIRRTG